MGLPSWLSTVLRPLKRTDDDLTPPSRLREILTPSVEPEPEQDFEQESEQELAPPSRLRQILAPAAEPEEDLAPPSRLRQILGSPTDPEDQQPSRLRQILSRRPRELAAILPAPAGVKQFLQSRTQLQAIVLGSIAIAAVLGIS